MKKKTYIVRILVTGGILTPRFMQQITKIAKKSGNTTISFGSRQDILFNVPKQQKKEIADLLNTQNISFEWKDTRSVKSQNIVTSYIATDILKGTSWINSSTYLNILELFNYNPTLRVNIVDPKQKLVPLFSGNLNFVASEMDNYWFLFIKKNGREQIHEWPVLIYGPQIALICQFLEPSLDSDEVNIPEWFLEINKKYDLSSINKKKNIEITSEFAPYYEGINKMDGREDYWVGFYWRNNKYTIEFIEYVCELCLHTKIAKISISPWKSFLVKNIKENDKILWDQLVGIFGINMRHSSLDMFWHLPYGSSRALQLKNYLVKKLNKIDIRTYGLTFSIGRPEVPFTSVIIKPKGGFYAFGPLNRFIQYEVWHAVDFNPETNRYFLFATGVEKYELSKTLINLTKKFYQTLRDSTTELAPEKPYEPEKLTVYQCVDCLQVYAEAVGDELSKISPQTAFRDLPDSYCCSACGSSKERFNQIELDREMIFAN